MSERDKMENYQASVCYLPVHSGDGYGFGGGAIFVVGGYAFPVGEDREAAKIAQRLAKLWNENCPQKDAPQ